MSRILEAFERIKNDPEKYAFYKQNPILLATFNACYEYVKAGYRLDDLGWFHTPCPDYEIIAKNNGEIYIRGVATFDDAKQVAYRFFWELRGTPTVTINQKFPNQTPTEVITTSDVGDIQNLQECYRSKKVVPSNSGGGIVCGKLLHPYKGSIYYGTKVHVDDWIYESILRWIPEYSYICEEELEHIVNLGAKVYEVLEL